MTNNIDPDIRDTIAGFQEGDIAEIAYEFIPPSGSARKASLRGTVAVRTAHRALGRATIDARWIGTQCISPDVVTQDWGPAFTITSARVIKRYLPPEPPLRVGDWVRDRDGVDRQILSERGLTNCHNLTRIEPPVGWPVGVPTIDAPTVWYFKSTSSGKYVWCGDVEIDFSWTSLLAAGGVPAIQP